MVVQHSHLRIGAEEWPFQTWFRCLGRRSRHRSSDDFHSTWFWWRRQWRPPELTGTELTATPQMSTWSQMLLTAIYKKTLSFVWCARSCKKVSNSFLANNSSNNGKLTNVYFQLNIGKEFLKKIQSRMNLFQWPHNITAVKFKDFWLDKLQLQARLASWICCQSNTQTLSKP